MGLIPNDDLETENDANTEQSQKFGFGLKPDSLSKSLSGKNGSRRGSAAVHNKGSLLDLKPVQLDKPDPIAKENDSSKAELHIPEAIHESVVNSAPK